MHSIDLLYRSLIRMRRRSVTLVILAFVLVLACRKDGPDDPVVNNGGGGQGGTGVSVDLAQVPYDSLSKYRFFTGAMKDLVPADGVLPYEPTTPLFSDYAHKLRFVWMPPGMSATYVADTCVMEFPEGAVLIKNFYYDHVLPQDERRIMETRLLIRKNGAWVYAEYIWNAEQTEAVMDLGGSNTPVQWVDDNGTVRDLNYRFPSATECHTCHKLGDTNIPIGPKPQNLNADLAYADGTMNQLAKWAAVGYLAPGYPASINTVVRWNDPAQSLNDRVRAYVDANCSHCHANGRYCDYRPMRFAWHATVDPAMLGVCVAPHDPLLPVHTHIVKPGNLEKSLLYYRVASDVDGVRMPLVGRSLVHEEGRALIEAWILSLTQTCN